MSKDHSSRKNEKKKPAKTKDEKRKAKRMKADEKRPGGGLFQQPGAPGAR